MTEEEYTNELLALSINVVSQSAELVKSFGSAERKILNPAESTREVKIRADHTLEEFLLAGLQKTGLDILSEERGKIKGAKQSNLRFIIDPLDGSYNFHRGMGPCAISVALWQGNSPIFGVIYNILNDCIIWGGEGFGANTHAGKKLCVSKISDLRHSVLHTGFPVSMDLTDMQLQNQFWNFVSTFSKTRMIGSAAMSLLKVASGQSECYRETGIMIWDVAAGLALVQGAGGFIQFRPLRKANSLEVLATNKALAAELSTVF